jgi:long-chain acyl-CoA synthetase
MYLVPVNWHLTARRSRTSCGLGRRCSFYERFGARARRRRRLNFAPERRFAVGKIGGFRPFAELSPGSPSDAASRRRRRDERRARQGGVRRPPAIDRRGATLGTASSRPA